MNLFKKTIKYLLLLKKFPRAKLYYGVNVDKNSSVGVHAVLFCNVNLINSTIDNYSYVQDNSILANAHIGKFSSIAANVFIGLPEHPISMVSLNPVFYDNMQPLPFFFIKDKMFESLSKITTIKSDVWIGQNAMVKSGVTIGVGAVVGAGAVVTKDVEPYSVVGGVPAKHIKYRFEKDIRERLLASKWWDFDEPRLTMLAPYFQTPEIFLRKLKEFDEI